MQPPYQQPKYQHFPPYQLTNTTKYPSSLAPTQAAHSSNPYETTEQVYLNHYTSNPYELPPPPPKHKTYKWLYILLLVVVAVVPVTLYHVVTTELVTTKDITIVVTPTPQPTYNVTDPGLSMNEVSGKQIWECTLANLDTQGTVHTNITLKNQILWHTNVKGPRVYFQTLTWQRMQI